MTTLSGAFPNSRPSATLGASDLPLPLPFSPIVSAESRGSLSSRRSSTDCRRATLRNSADRFEMVTSGWTGSASLRHPGDAERSTNPSSVVLFLGGRDAGDSSRSPFAVLCFLLGGRRRSLKVSSCSMLPSLWGRMRIQLPVTGFDLGYILEILPVTQREAKNRRYILLGPGLIMVMRLELLGRDGKQRAGRNLRALSPPCF